MPVEGKPDRHPGGQPDGARNTGAALEAHYRFVLWLVPAVERFPRSRKFLMGDRIQGAALDVLERLIEATYLESATPAAQPREVDPAGGSDAKTEPPSSGAESAPRRSDGNLVGGGSALLVVETKPAGVEVLIGDQSVGETPLELANLRPGAYNLRLRHPHYDTVHLEGQRFADGEVLRIERTLRRGVGKLTVLTTPRNAWVERDGERLASRTPVTLEGLPAGALQLTLGADGHRTAQVRAEVPKDGLGRLQRALEPIVYGTLTLELVPADAAVTLPDIGPPYRPGMRLPEGRHRVVAKREGYADARLEVAVPGNGEARERIELSPLPPPFTVEASPATAQVRLADRSEGYRAGMLLPWGEYHVTVSAESYVSKTETVRHGASGPTVHRVELWKLRRFRDCPECPELVVVPSGSFQMGSPSHEQGHGGDEGPVHRVRIGKPFAVGVYEVTFAEWDACVTGGGCGGHRPNDRGWGRGRRPAVNLSWQDAGSYVSWLSRRTGGRYRLLSESEWEYVARAGTTTPFHTGSTISTDQANYDGDYVYGPGRKGVDRKRTVSVGSFPANGFGLRDVHGNIWEWVQDCWNDSYAGAPSDGSAWESGDCSRRVLRGGSWVNTPRNLRSAIRHRVNSGNRNLNYGFRVARTLTP